VWCNWCMHAVCVKRNNRAQAARAWGRAKPWRPLLNNGTDTGPIGTESICGANSLVADNSITNCRILSRYGNNYFTCSAFKIGERLLGTAGGCHLHQCLSVMLGHSGSVRCASMGWL